MILGFLINDRHPLFETISLSQINENLNKPVLIVGVEKALEYDSNISLTSNIINDNVTYIFSKEESEEYQIQLDKYIALLFNKFSSRYIIKDVSKNPNSITFDEDCFYYETNKFITITANKTIYYINKEIFYFFNKTQLDLKLPENTYSWNRNIFFEAYLKTLNLHIPLDSLRALYKNYGDIDLYLGGICLEWLTVLKAKISDYKTLSLWKRAYSIESQISELKIKINTKKIKDASDDNTLFQTIYNSLQGNYVVQKYSGTDKITGRMYAKDSEFSLQTLAKKNRDIVIAEKDCVLIEFDYDYFEYFLLSQICNYELHGDPHLYISKLIYGDELHRQQGKTINYAVLYGQSIEKTIQELNLEGDTDKLTILFNEIIQPIEPLKLELLNKLKTNGSFMNHFGRQIFPTKEHACISNYISSTATDYFIIKLEKLFALLKQYSGNNKIVLQNHDSVLLNLEVKTVEETNIVEDIKALLEEKEDGIYGKVSFNYGYDWGNLQ